MLMIRSQYTIAGKNLEHPIIKLHIFSPTLTDFPGVNFCFYIYQEARRAGSDGSMSTSDSAGPGFDPR